MDKDKWIKQQIRNYGSFKSFLVVYMIIVAMFLAMAFIIT